METLLVQGLSRSPPHYLCFQLTGLWNDSLEVSCWSGSPAGFVVTPSWELGLPHPVIIGQVFWLVWAMEEFCNIFMYILVSYACILSQLKWLIHKRRKEKNKFFRSCRIEMALLNQSSSDGSVIMVYLPRSCLLLRVQKLPRCLALVNQITHRVICHYYRSLVLFMFKLAFSKDRLFLGVWKIQHSSIMTHLVC